ncbi:MAG: hypothetical protein PHU71_02420 [Candidatus Gracilibacteria bacterium]|nr:hypothetical protein [Candidatus Gracilibacteria bacterium]
MEKKLVNLEKRLKKIEERNRKVEADKAWETSLFRILTITVLTYLVITAYMWSVEIPNPFLNAIVPAVGYFLSAQSLPFIKRWWVGRKGKKFG